MGDAPKESKKPVTVLLVVREDAHIDESWTVHGFVSKTQSLRVGERIAKSLLAAHPYLTKMGE